MAITTAPMGTNIRDTQVHGDNHRTNGDKLRDTQVQDANHRTIGNNLKRNTSLHLSSILMTELLK